MARIAGVDLPPKKRAEIGLTYIYGIGRTRAKSLLYRAGIDLNKKIGDLTEEEVNNVRNRFSKKKARSKAISARKFRSTSSATSKWAPIADCGIAAACRPADSAPTPTPAPARVRARAPWPTRRKRRRRLNGESTGKDGQEEGLQEEGKAHCPQRASCTSRRRSTTRS
jgi:hypothetical protein